MKKTKKLLALPLVGLLTVALVACGNNANVNSSVSNDYVTVHQYRGLPIDVLEPQIITDENIDAVIEGMLASDAVTEDITHRPAEDGDTVNIDFVGKIDEEIFENGSAEGSNLTIGSGFFIGATDDYEGFEEQIIGHNIGDEFRIEVQFPDPYMVNPEMAGVVATFDITLNSISRTITPELTDEWVQANSEEGSTTVAEYREEIRTMITENQNSSITRENQNRALQALMEQMEVIEIPEDMINEEIATIVTYYEQLADANQIELEDFLMQSYGIDMATFHSEVENIAAMSVARRIAIELVATAENLHLSEAEYEAAIQQFALEAGFDDVDEYIAQFGIDLIRNTVLQIEVADFILEHSVAPSAEESVVDAE